MKDFTFQRIRFLAGMSLVEILVVAAIILVLTGLVAPVLVEAKRRSHNAVAISNMRQSGMALLIYSDDQGGLTGLPTRPAADELLAKAPTCDPRDYFRMGCDSPSPQPHIGSFAYVRDEWVLGDEAKWRYFLAAHERSSYSPALLINLFVSNKRHQPGNWFGEYLGNPHPDQVQMFEADGGVRLYRPSSRPDIGYTWETLFLKR